MSSSDNITISVKAWSEVMTNIPANCTEINKFVSSLPQTQQYIYFARFPFGTNLIENGCIPISKFKFTPNGEFLPKNANDLKNDLDYSNDPLGLVLKNHIEVYAPNKSNDVTYSVPLVRIKEGEFFGLFGTLDHLSERNNKKSGNLNWNVIAGNICFEILFPFENKKENSCLCGEYAQFARHLGSKDSTIENSHLKDIEKNKFVNICICELDWAVEVIYFPKHIITGLTHSAQNELFKIGWLQSTYSRDILFDKSVSDLLDNTSRTHDDLLLVTLYHYILKAIKGEAYILSPVKQDHILGKALSKFKENGDIAKYLCTKKSYHPIILNYDIMRENDWGLLASNFLPVLLNHNVKKPTKLYQDLNNLLQKQQPPPFKLDYVTYSKTAPQKQELQQKILNYLNLSHISNEAVCLTSKGLSDFLIISKI